MGASIDSFWELIERSQQERGDLESRATWIREQLTGRSPAEIVEFQVAFNQIRRRADTWRMWGAAYTIGGGCSDDGFWYFQAWLIGLGREIYERVVGDPDALAECDPVLLLAGQPACAPGWESLDYVAAEAYEQVTGDDRRLYDEVKASGHDNLGSPEPTDEPWDFDDEAEVERRLPRLLRLFPFGAA